MSNAEEQRNIQYVNYFTIALADNGEVVAIKMFVKTPDIGDDGKLKGELSQEAANVIMTASNATILANLILDVQKKSQEQAVSDKRHG